MHVTASRSGNTATVTLVYDIADIIALPDTTNAQKRQLALQRAKEVLRDAIVAAPQTDAEIDARVTQEQTSATRIKASRPTGNL